MTDVRALDPRSLRPVVAEQPHPLVFASVSGAHLYGFPSVDSDVDLRGAHVLPPEEVVGLRTGPQTLDRSEHRDGLEMDLDEKLLAPTVVQTLIYGLFAAWLDSDDPHEFEWVGASYTLSMPVYADIVYAILTPGFVRACNLIPGLQAAARVLSWVDRAAFTESFDGTSWTVESE